MIGWLAELVAREAAWWPWHLGALALSWAFIALPARMAKRDLRRLRERLEGRDDR